MQESCLLKEIFANVKLLIIGGLKTASDLVSVALFALLQHPNQLSQVLSNPKLIGPSIEEAVRWLSPVGTATQTTNRACELSSTHVPAGAMVAGVLAAANRDPRVFRDPEQFNIHRREGGHLAFAVGPHACVGALLGRYEADVGLRVLFENLSDLQLDPVKPVAVRGWEFCAPVELNCVFEGRGRRI
jgi:cytochrome P450